MREIKFRCWDIKERRMFNVAHDCMFSILDDFDFKPMQYTGLKDKNGKEIYEGDIVRSIRAGNKNAEVKWYYHECRFDAELGYEPKDFYELAADDRIEIIGNIYENPDLLK